MPKAAQTTENITVAVPSDLLQLLDDLCVRKDLHRTQVVVRAVKMYLAVEASRDCSFFSTLYQAREEAQLLKIKK